MARLAGEGKDALRYSQINKNGKKKPKMGQRRNLRIFLASMLGTLCLVGLLLGLSEVDTQCRKIGFGDNKTLIYQITGKNLNLTCNTAKICYNIFE